MKKYLLGIDVGTTNVKAVLFTEDGQVVARASRGTYVTKSPYVSWAEQDANLWWEDTAYAISQIVKQIESPANIAGICVSSQGVAMTPVDKEGEPVHDAIIWMDKRTTPQCEKLLNAVGRERFEKKFLGLPDPMFQMPKILWFKENEPELFARTSKILMTGSFVNFKLTGVMAVDSMQAASSMVYDNEEKCWSRDFSDAFDIPLADMMPAIMPPEAAIGGVSREAAEKTGLAEGTPVMCGCADAMAAMVEVGLTRLGEGAEITGTSSNILFTTDKPVPRDSRLRAQMSMIPTPGVKSLLFGAINNTGGSLKWFLHTLAADAFAVAREHGANPYDVLNERAEQAPAGCRGLIYFPYLLGERAPLWNDYVKGMFIGFTSGSNRNDFARAVMEGTSFAFREVYEEALRSGATINRIMITGGCANSDIWLRIKASIVRQPLSAIVSSGGGPLGDAIIAGVGAGLYADYEQAIEQVRRIDKVVEPVQEWIPVYNELYERFVSMRNHLDADLRLLKEMEKHYNM